VSGLEDYVISRRGADYVLYEGLLAEAHRQGLKAILTRLVQAPTEENGRLAVCSAVVETKRGRFCGLGEARVTEARSVLGKGLVGLAETRAKARALRDAVGARQTPIEDLDMDGTATG
jgi:hypothetical protein